MTTTDSNPAATPGRDTTDAEGALLRIDQLTAGYLPGVNILTDCDFHCHEGELVGIIGPNGAGKSTLLKAIFGLVNVRGGNIELRGESLKNKKANQLVSMGVGYVPQNNNVFPSLTIEENLQMGLYHDPKRFDERFDYVAELFPALGTRRKQRAGSLSGGERQMVAMGRALMMEPSVLLLDEPSSGLDRTETERFGEVLLDLVEREGRGILMVEHDMALVMDICDHCFVLDFGKPIFDGTPAELATSEVVRAAYLGSEAAALGGPVDAPR